MARVLVIEDEPNITLILKTVLTEEGHNVITASDGGSGLEHLSHAPAPDIVFVDLHIPVISGKGVIERMRSELKLSDIPVVIMTGSIYNHKEFPPQDYYNALVEKPFDIFDIVETVEKLTPKGMKRPFKRIAHCI
ncbi:MAG: response regulator [Desulfotomaculaceae bacterium]